MIVPDENGKIPCSTCGDPRPASEFKRHPQKGIDRRCKACNSKRGKVRNARPEIKKRNKKRDATRRADPAKRKELNDYSRAYGMSMPRERRMLQCARLRALEKGWPFTITLSDIVIPAVCPLLGIPITRGKGKLHAGSPSLDRKHPARGYTPDNVWVISYRANAIKHDASVSELLLLTRRLVRLLGNQE